MLLPLLEGRQFRDAAFAGFYCSGSGRYSLPPSLLATALPPQPRDEVSYAEAKVRADFDRFPSEVGFASGQIAPTNPIRQRAGDLPFRRGKSFEVHWRRLGC